MTLPSADKPGDGLPAAIGGDWIVSGPTAAEKESPGHRHVGRRGKPACGATGWRGEELCRD